MVILLQLTPSNTFLKGCCCGIDRKALFWKIKKYIDNSKNCQFALSPNILRKEAHIPEMNRDENANFL